MLVKIKSGMAIKLIHKGIRYFFSEKEIKDCPESILSGYKGIVVAVEQKKETKQTQNIIFPNKMPIINADQPKIKIPQTKKGKTGKKNGGNQ